MIPPAEGSSFRRFGICHSTPESRGGEETWKVVSNHGGACGEATCVSLAWIHGLMMGGRWGRYFEGVMTIAGFKLLLPWFSCCI